MTTIPPEISVSIVVYRPDERLLRLTIESLAAAAEAIAPRTVRLTLVDNTPEGASLAWVGGIAPGLSTDILSGHGNIGFGRGHNLALVNTSRFHLILNPDVEMARDCLEQALRFMEDHNPCGLLVPAAFHPDGERNYLCKRYPSVLDLLLRGFAPKSVRSRFRERLAQYEMRDVLWDEVRWNPPIVSGCFMFYRSAVLDQLDGFDPGYFLYFEDFDLSLRTRALTAIAYVPAVRIVHFGGYAAGKGMRHILYFVRSAVRFFSTHGWRSRPHRQDDPCSCHVAHLGD